MDENEKIGGEYDAAYWHRRAMHYRREARAMRDSMRHAWDIVAIANKRLREAGMQPVCSPIEKA